ncbi:hypothetical protein [Vibrio cholerae]
MAMNIEQRLEQSAKSIEQSSQKAHDFAEKDTTIQTCAGSRDSLPKVSRIWQENFARQMNQHATEFQDRFALSQQSLPWQASITISDSLQRYHVGVQGEEGYKEFLPNPVKLPFETAATLAEDLTQDRWLENGVPNKHWTESNIASALEKSLGVNARIWPKDRDLQVGDVIPSAQETADGLQITHLIVDGNAYAMSPIVTGRVTAISATDAEIGGVIVSLLSPTPNVDYADFGGFKRQPFDIFVKKKPVHIFDGISDLSEIAKIQKGTSTLDISSIFQAAANYAASRSRTLSLEGCQKINVSNILLPANGIEIYGAGSLLCDIYNPDGSNPVFYQATGRNRWAYLDGFRIISPDGATAPALNFVDYEHLGWGRIEVSTLPTQRTLAPAVNISRSGPSGFGYYLDCGVLKVDKHQYGVKMLGVSGANLNANVLRGVIANDNTNANIRVDWCSGLSITAGSSELALNNVEIFDCIGVTVSDYYMERPEQHNVQIVRGDSCRVIGNRNLSAAGSGVNNNGSPINPSGVGVFVDQSVGVQIKDNLINENWNFYDVQITSSCVATEISDNLKRDRVKKFTEFKLEVNDAGIGTTGSNYTKTAGGSVFKVPVGSGISVLGNTRTTNGNFSVGAANLPQLSGAGSPEGSVTAIKGSTYTRSDGGSGFSKYIKDTATGNTGWRAYA